MSHELMITSAPRGLLPGSMGFCTVAMTPQMPSALQQRLETLSGYRHLFSQADSKSKLNPVCYQHLRLQVAGKKYSVLSRICDAGLDYTERTNKFGHHLALLPEERPNCGPAELMLQQSLFTTSWQGEPRELPKGRSYSAPERQQGVAIHWKSTTGDAGWAGILAEMTLKDSSDPIFLEYTPGTDLLPLLAEALFYLPKAERWNVTYSTYYQGLPPDVACLWRGVVSGSPEWKQARSRQSRMISVLPSSKAPEGGTLAAWARTGIQPQDVAAFAETNPEDKPYPLDQGLNKPQISRGSNEPFELSRKSTSPSRPTTSEERTTHKWFSLPSVLLGLLCGILITSFFAFTLWMTLSPDPNLEIVRQLPIAPLDQDNKAPINNNDMIAANSTIPKGEANNKKPSDDKSNTPIPTAIVPVPVSTKPQEKQPLSAPVPEPVPVPEAAAEKPVPLTIKPPIEKQPIEPIKRHTAHYFDFSSVLINNPSTIQVNTIDTGSVTLKSIELLRPREYFWINLISENQSPTKTLLDLNENGTKVLLYKKTSRPGASRQDIFSIGIQDGKLTATFHVEEKNEVLSLLRTSLFKLERQDGELLYITSIKTIADADRSKKILPFTSTVNCDTDEIHRKPMAKQYYIPLGKEGNSTVTKSLNTTINEMVAAYKTDSIIQYDSTTSSSNELYDVKVKASRSNRKNDIYSPKIDITIRYTGQYVDKNRPATNGDAIAASLRELCKMRMVNSVKLDSLSIRCRIHDVDVVLWKLE